MLLLSAHPIPGYNGSYLRMDNVNEAMKETVPLEKVLKTPVTNRK